MHYRGNAVVVVKTTPKGTKLVKPRKDSSGVLKRQAFSVFTGIIRMGPQSYYIPKGFEFF